MTSLQDRRSRHNRRSTDPPYAPAMTMYANGSYPTWPVNTQTLVFDVNENRQVCLFDGQVILPAGSVIELYDEEKIAHGTATVVGIRMLSGTATVANQICLDVEVDDRWWQAHPRVDD